MRKLLTIIAGAILAAVAISGCSKNLKEKQQDGELSAADYGEMVDYMYDAMVTLNDINQTADPSDMEGTQELIKEVVAEYPEVRNYYEICIAGFKNGDSEFEKGIDESKMARIIDCDARGWINFW